MSSVPCCNGTLAPVFEVDMEELRKENTDDPLIFQKKQVDNGRDMIETGATTDTVVDADGRSKSAQHVWV